jgi:hypothetical protein
MVSDKNMASQCPPPAICRIGPEAAAVDLWLHRGLVDRFDVALSEQLPQELVLLVARLFH